MTWTSYWAERSAKAEEFEARSVDVLGTLRTRHSHVLPYGVIRDIEELLGAHRRLNAWRAGALPAGATKIGNLSSGGIDL